MRRQIVMLVVLMMGIVVMTALPAFAGSTGWGDNAPSCGPQRTICRVMKESSPAGADAEPNAAQIPGQNGSKISSTGDRWERLLHTQPSEG